MNPDLLEKYFVPIQVAVVAILLFSLWRSRQKGDSQSGFRVRESDRTQLSPENSPEIDPSPLQLEGVQTDGLPHEILGVSASASEEDILKAYRDLMKRYHPDKVAALNSPQWQEAQQIASAINEAKESLLKQRTSSE